MPNSISEEAHISESTHIIELLDSLIEFLGLKNPNDPTIQTIETSIISKILTDLLNDVSYSRYRIEILVTLAAIIGKFKVESDFIAAVTKSEPKINVDYKRTAVSVAKIYEAIENTMRWPEFKKLTLVTKASIFFVRSRESQVAIRLYRESMFVLTEKYLTQNHIPVN